VSPRLRKLWHAIDACLLADRAKLRAILRTAAAEPDEGLRETRLDAVKTRIDASRARVGERAARVPAIVYPDDLPVAVRRDEIAAAIRDNQVIVLCGATGSGKTTQLPKICLELGRGVAGMIGHTQPRRIAARSVATRIASELGTRVPIGGGRATGNGSTDGRSPGGVAPPDGAGIVGCSVRFDDRTAPETMVRLMTDGILLAETPHDRLLRRYDTIIVDEAHERSLNIDFLLGYLHGILPRRPDLKVIVTSATIDPERFSAHFGGAPIVMVEGRTYPVRIEWRPVHPDSAEAVDEAEDPTLQSAILDAVDELATIDRGEGLEPGDVLVFLSGEREIHEIAAALRGRLRPGDEVLPLYARLSSDEQDRVFSAHAGRRIVLATNVAETSLTVPGIRHVIDSGLARISRRSVRTTVHRLPIEPISQASADQRAGRCGRTGPGVCIRLYSQRDYDGRPRYTDPEILRSDLASVILRMKALRLGPIEEFPFPDRPLPRAIAAGNEALLEIGAIDRDGELTGTGRRLAHWPIDPRLGRMLIAAETEHVLPETIVIVAALATQDPRIRPAESPGLADLAHARFRDQSSDFLSMLRLWDEWRRRRDGSSADALGSSALRRWCKENSLSWIRMREWEETQRQLIDLLLRERGRRGASTASRSGADGGRAASTPTSSQTAVQAGRRAETRAGREAATQPGREPASRSGAPSGDHPPCQAVPTDAPAGPATTDGERATKPKRRRRRRRRGGAKDPG